MITLKSFTRAVLLVVSLLCLAGPAIADEPSPDGLEFFEKHVRPLLASKCLKCHATDTKQQGELTLDTKAGWEMGGESGPSIVPGKPDESVLISAIRFDSLEMPPSKQLTDEEIDVFVKWVEMGAPDPRVDGGPAAAAQGIDIEKGRAYWAFQQPQKHAPPEVKNAAWPRSDIDRFVLAQQEAAGVSPVADADRRSLIRRATFDLTGLPPTREEVESFVNDASNDETALAKVVDRLLASPRFGERWGRHWLDVARFGETQTNVQLRYAWKYREYVIDAINADMPFDQFIREQIAGDLLPADDDAMRDRQVIATGFLALGDRNVGQIDEVVDEQIDCTTKAFMALTVSCARCHNHKFDPIPTEDYYAMAGIFRSTQVQRSGVKNKPASPLAGCDMEKQKAFQEKLEAFRTDTVRSFQTAKQNRDRADRELKTLQSRYRDKPSDEPRPDVQKAEQKLQETQQAFDKAQQAYDTAMSELQQLEQPVACAVAESAKPADQRVFIRGDRQDQGDIVPRGFVQVASAGGKHLIEDKKQSGRLELAHWIASSENPLTCRTAVNRVWQHLFGVGIVPTSDNFGSLGERPSHPELLDYLAVEFAEDGWSVKRLVRRIVLSRTYRLSTSGNSQNEELDGDNRLLWRMNRRRLDAESIRDAILTFSGRLQLEPPDAGQLANLAYQRPDFDDPHRSVYLPVLRTGGYEFFSAFDGSDPTIVVGRRDVSTVPTQVLYLLNSPLAIDESRRAAERLFEAEKMDDNGRVDLAYWLALSRAPDENERKAMLEFVDNFPALLKQEGKFVKDVPREAWAQACQALIASAEFQILN
ncbi:MAG: DUF1553 domain-containing protein [Planctomycetales bacterium]|nr:DUF1553 domain-containing protein [Planctomycetales bacterium]